MRRSAEPTVVRESLARLAEAAGPEHARDVRVIRRAVQEALATSDEVPDSCSAPAAAEELGVTLPTVHIWVKAGVLRLAPESSQRRVRLDRPRVDLVARKLRELRRRSPRARKLRDILEWLEYEKDADRLSGPRRISDRRDMPVRERLAEIWGTRRRRAAAKRR